MPRLLLTAIIVFAAVLGAGYLLANIVAALRRLMAAETTDSAGTGLKRIGYGYLLVCWLVCSVVITALIWEYWF